jgi:MinD-like ATPase involved in chromosome partitioning or flagellar assembly
VVGVERERERPLPSIERALSGPGSRDEMGWHRQVKVVAGGQGPGKRDQEALDRDRARLPLTGSYRIVVLGCTRGAGQTVTALMAGHILAATRGVPVAALDLTSGPTSLAARRPPVLSVRALLAGQEAGQEVGQEAGQEAEQRPAQDVRLDVIASLPASGAPGNGAPGNGNGAHPLDSGDFRRLADLLAERYPLTMIDPAPSGLTRVLARADQLVLVAPASPEAATSLANTQQWLGAHGYGELAARAVTVVNGVSRRTKDDVLRAESVARGRCRAIVRVPWDDLLSSRQASRQEATPETIQPQTRLAYTALAGVLIAGLAATNPPNTPNTPNTTSAVPGRNPGEHAD